MTRIVDLIAGFLATFDRNEVQHVSTEPDPPKYRLAVNEDQVESNLGALSFNTRRHDGELDERAYIMGRLTASKRGGAVYIAVDGHEVFYIDHGAAIFRVPVYLEMPDGARVRVGIGNGPSGTIALRARANGKLVCADAAPHRPLLANRDVVGEWEMFDVIAVS